MNIVFVLADSLNRHYVSPYADDADTPNISRFAQGAWRFDNHYVGSLPCIPARRELFSGFQEMMWRPWGPLEPFDARLPRLLQNAGYATGMVTDHYHYWEEPGNGYLQGFQSTELIRGHEVDNWRLPAPDDAEVPRWVSNTEKWRPGDGPRRYYGNVRDFTDEHDFFTAKVIRAGIDWLEENAGREPFFLQVECFDVHEPFHVPEPYRSMYWNGDDPEKYTVWPPYQNKQHEASFAAEASEDETAYVRAQYRAKVKMFDAWFGELLDTFDRLGLWDNTMIVLGTDHGHDLCERGAFGKQYPHYDTHARIPLLVHHPALRTGSGDGTVTAPTTTVDLFATFLDAAGAGIPTGTHGRSLLPFLAGDGSQARTGVLYGTFGQGVCCTDGEWTVFKGPETDGPLYYYSSGIFRSLHIDGRVPPEDQGYYIPGVELPQWKVPLSLTPRSRENRLYHRALDPGQVDDLWDSHPEQRDRMLRLMCELLEEQGIPEEQYERLGLQPWRRRR